VAFVENGSVRLFSRSQRDVSAEFPEFQDLAKHLRAGTAILDGEIVTLDENGRSDFQKAAKPLRPSASPRKSSSATSRSPIISSTSSIATVFDVRKSPLLQRKEFLRQLLSGDDRRALFRAPTRERQRTLRRCEGARAGRYRRQANRKPVHRKSHWFSGSNSKSSPNSTP